MFLRSLIIEVCASILPAFSEKHRSCPPHPNRIRRPGRPICGPLSLALHNDIAWVFSPSSGTASHRTYDIPCCHYSEIGPEPLCVTIGYLRSGRITLRAEASYHCHMGLNTSRNMAIPPTPRRLLLLSSNTYKPEAFFA
jgi:hypothetical protein